MNWYCIHTKPLREDQVKLHLERRLGLEVYYPRLQRTRRIRRVKRVVINPLFPRYLFCQFDPAIHYRAVRYSPDIVDVVRCGGEPQVVDEEIITTLREWAGEAFDLITAHPPMKPGDRVEIQDGPLQSLCAIVMEDRPERDRVAVLLEAMGCGARLFIERSNLARVV